MFTSSWKRALALLAGIWLAIVMAEPAALHSCPLHGSAAAGAHAGMAHDGVAHGTHGARAEQSPAHAPLRDAGHQCSCLGDCGIGGLQQALLPDGHPARWVPAAVLRGATAIPRALAAAPPASDHVLPFANGPPARA
jgi:hypothetical protein